MRIIIISSVTWQTFGSLSIRMEGTNNFCSWGPHTYENTQKDMRRVVGLKERRGVEAASNLHRRNRDLYFREYPVLLLLCARAHTHHSKACTRFIVASFPAGTKRDEERERRGRRERPT